MKKKYNKKSNIVFSLIAAIVIALAINKEAFFNSLDYSSYSLDNVPVYTSEPYVIIDDNEPNFEDSLKNKKSFEKYSELDKYGRAGVALANIGSDLLATEERGSIGSVKPSGWHTIKYDIVDGKYLYNRCHLIGYQLTGENANEKNLITCTRYMNTVGMLKFENAVTDYIKKTNKRGQTPFV